MNKHKFQSLSLIDIYTVVYSFKISWLKGYVSGHPAKAYFAAMSAGWEMKNIPRQITSLNYIDIDAALAILKDLYRRKLIKGKSKPITSGKLAVHILVNKPSFLHLIDFDRINPRYMTVFKFMRQKIMKGKKLINLSGPNCVCNEGSDDSELEDNEELEEINNNRYILCALALGIDLPQYLGRISLKVATKRFASPHIICHSRFCTKLDPILYLQYFDYLLSRGWFIIGVHGLLYVKGLIDIFIKHKCLFMCLSDLYWSTKPNDSCIAYLGGYYYTRSHFMAELEHVGPRFLTHYWNQMTIIVKDILEKLDENPKGIKLLRLLKKINV